MKHTLHRITKLELAGPHSLKLRSADGLERTVNLEPMLAGEFYGPLHDPMIFAQVALDPEVGTAVWPNGADFDPATLHDWPEHEAAFHEAARPWIQEPVLA